MRERNMWISEPGREKDIIIPQLRDQDLGRATLGAGDQSQDATVEDEHPTSNELSANNLLADSGLSLDELVPRTWKKW